MLVHLGTRVVVLWGITNHDGDLQQLPPEEFHLVTLKDPTFEHLRNAVNAKRAEVEARYLTPAPLPPDGPAAAFAAPETSESEPAAPEAGSIRLFPAETSPEATGEASESVPGEAPELARLKPRRHKRR